MDMTMVMTSSMTQSATMSMIMPTNTSEIAAATMLAMSMSMGDTGGCKLSVSTVHPEYSMINTFSEIAPSPLTLPDAS
jgi:hypothetical protein